MGFPLVYDLWSNETQAWDSICQFLQIILLKYNSFQLNSCFLLHSSRKASLASSTKARMSQFMDSNSMPMQIENLKEKMQEVVPEPVKVFPWKEAEKMLLERLLFMGKEASKWSLLVFFVFSSLSDFVASIFRNQELLIPIGLFVGVLLTDLLKEISQEVFGNSEVHSAFAIGSYTFSSCHK